MEDGSDACRRICGGRCCYKKKQHEYWSAVGMEDTFKFSNFRILVKFRIPHTNLKKQGSFGFSKVSILNMTSSLFILNKGS
jgi:hypothetical protein